MIPGEARLKPHDGTDVLLTLRNLKSRKVNQLVSIFSATDSVLMERQIKQGLRRLFQIPTEHSPLARGWCSLPHSLALLPPSLPSLAPPLSPPSFPPPATSSTLFLLPLSLPPSPSLLPPPLFLPLSLLLNPLLQPGPGALNLVRPLSCVGANQCRPWARSPLREHFDGPE